MIKLRTDIPGMAGASGASKPVTGAASTLTDVVDVQLTPTERKQLTTTKSEPEEHPDDRAHRLHKDIVLFWVCVVVVLAALGGAVAGLILAPSLDDKRWLQSVITLILGGFIGYTVKK